MSGRAGIEKNAFLPLTWDHEWLTQVSMTPVCFRTQAPPHLVEAKLPPEKDVGQAAVVTCESMHAWMSSYPGPLHLGGTEIPGEISHTLSLLTARRCSAEKLSDRNSPVRDQLLKARHFLTSLALKSTQQIL